MADVPLPGEMTPAVPARDAELPPPAEDEAVMSLVDHLTELRARLARTVVWLVVACVVGYFAATPIVDRLTALTGAHFQIIGIGGAFFVTIKMALVVGVALTLPFAVYELWQFVRPGLTPGERAAVRPWLPLAAVFFAVGLGVAWIVLPFAMGFLGSFAFANTVYQPSLESYFDFVLLMFLAFGLVMEFPIVLVVLVKVGLLRLALLRRNRRYAFLGIVIFAVVITPGGDPISPSVMSLVMYALYELTIFILGRTAPPSRVDA